jgi:hypothetical protein
MSSTWDDAVYSGRIDEYYNGLSLARPGAA